jgi:hypothetical protein
MRRLQSAANSGPVSGHSGLYCQRHQRSEVGNLTHSGHDSALSLRRHLPSASSVGLKSLNALSGA